jgi:hypothetical protein
MFVLQKAILDIRLLNNCEEKISILVHLTFWEASCMDAYRGHLQI